MDSNRLNPQPINLSTLGNSKNIPQKSTLRRRCRSECLQMAPINTTGQSKNDIKQYPINDNNLRTTTLTNDVRRKIAQQPNFRNMLMKYSSSTILRNQDSAKNIYSSTNNCKQNNLSTSSANGTAARLKNTTKENISKSTSMLNGGNNVLTENDQQPIIIDNNHFRRELSSSSTTRLHNKRMVNSTQYFFEQSNNLNRIASDCSNDFSDVKKFVQKPQLDWKSTTSINDTNHKRRVRARSESESQELNQMTIGNNNKCSPQKNYKFRGYDVSFKVFFLFFCILFEWLVKIIFLKAYFCAKSQLYRPSASCYLYSYSLIKIRFLIIEIESVGFFFFL